jgi:hypothetical protein
MSAGAGARGGTVTSGIAEESVRVHRMAAMVAWAAALATAVLLAIDLWLSNQNRLVGLTAAGDLTVLGMAVIGALIASQRPRNPVGWILCAVGFVATLGQFAWCYGYYGLAVATPPMPFAVQSLWVAQWLWLPALGAGLSTLVVRLPNGDIARNLQFVDWLAVSGAAALVVATALMPGVVDPRVTALNPHGVDGAQRVLVPLLWAGYAAVALAVLAPAASLVDRLRDSRGDEREQIKWIASAVAVVVAFLIYGLARRVFGGENLYDALVPFLVSTVTLPVAIGVAVLKYRLYDIDLLINRALVYGLMTAGLAGLYALSIALTQMLVGATGQRSAAAILVTAFVGTTAFTPAKGWLQTAVDSRFSVRDPVASMDSLRAQVEVVAEVLDAQRIARRLVEDLAADYRARFVSLSLNSDGQMIQFHTSGDPTGHVALTIPLRSKNREVGVLSLGDRIGGLPYRSRDHRALQDCADAVGDVIDLWRIGQSTMVKPGAAD